MSRARELAKAGGVQQRIVGVSSFVGVSTFAQDVNFYQDISVSGDLNVTGNLSYDSTTASSQRITGISTLNQTETNDIIVSAGATVTGALDVDGGADIASGLTVTGGLTANSAQVSDLTAGRVVIAGTSGELEDDAALSFSTSSGTLTATEFSGSGASLTSIPNGALDNSSITITAGDGLSGTATPSLGGSASLSVNVDDSSIEISSDTLQVKASGITNAMLAGSIANSKMANATVSYGGVQLSLGGSDATPAFDLTDATNYPASSLTGTVDNAGLTNDSVTITAGDGLSGGGSVDLGSSVSIGVQVDDSSLEISSDTVQVKASGITNDMLAGSIANSKMANATVSYGGVQLSLGGSDATPAFNLADATGLPVSTGIDGLGSNVATFLATPSSSNLRSAVTGETGSGALVFGTSPTIASPSISGGTFTGRQELDDASFSGGLTVGAGLTVTGDLVVNGTTTTINSTVISVDDKHLELGATSSPTDSSADGGGVILKGDSDHSILWYNDNDHWQSSEHFNLASGKVYQIADTQVLSATALGDGVVSSQLTSVGTIASGTWQGTAIANAYLANSSVSFGGVSVSLGAADATPAFDLQDATNLPTTSLTGTITNAQLAGSIANSKLSNSSVSLGGVSVSLGGSDATPAFDLSDATGLPTTALTGTITNAQLAGSIANGKLANSSVSFGGVSVSLGSADATPAFDLSDATNINASAISSGTISDARLPATITSNLSGTATNATNFNVAADNSTNATHYITFTGGATGNQRPNSDTALTYNPSSNTLTAGTFSGTLATSNLSGTISNSQLAGSIANSKLSNSSVSFGGVSVSLGGSDATPAFNLADATGLPISSGVSGLASNMATFLATPSSANLRSTVTDETGSGSLVFGTNPTLAGATLSADLVPNANGTIDLGASGTRFANVYSSDLDLSNEAKGPNSIDGTWGSYLIEEGEEHLYITNRRSGRRYRFMMEEV